MILGIQMHTIAAAPVSFTVISQMLKLVPFNLPVLAVCAELEWERFLVTFKVKLHAHCNLACRLWQFAIYASISLRGKAHLPAAFVDTGCLCSLQVLDGFLGRGLLQAFEALLTLELTLQHGVKEGTTDFDKSLQLYRTVAGVSLLVCSAFYIIGGILCFGRIRKGE